MLLDASDLGQFGIPQMIIGGRQAAKETRRLVGAQAAGTEREERYLTSEQARMLSEDLVRARLWERRVQTVLISAGALGIFGAGLLVVGRLRAVKKRAA